MAKSEISVVLPGSEPRTLDVATACRLIRAIVDDANAVRGIRITYKEAYRVAAERLKDQGLRLEPPAHERLEKFISKPYAYISDQEAAFLTEALQRHFFEGRTTAWLLSAIDTIRKPPARALPRTSFWGELLGIDPENQKRLKPLVGHYLLLRRLFTMPRFYVSYLAISESRRSADPLQFRTIGSARAAVPFSPDEPLVEGMIWAPGADSPFVFGVGRVQGKSEVRSAILQPVEKPAAGPAEKTYYDLAGIRLGLGRFDRRPRAYRIWCSRLLSADAAEARQAVGEYTLDQFSAAFRDKITGFDWITAWLSMKHFTVLRHEDDPTFPPGSATLA